MTMADAQVSQQIDLSVQELEQCTTRYSNPPESAPAQISIKILIAPGLMIAAGKYLALLYS
jgi:hypothetical protein